MVGSWTFCPGGREINLWIVINIDFDLIIKGVMLGELASIKEVHGDSLFFRIDNPVFFYAGIWIFV